MRLGVYGGGFNPPHIAHLLLAQEAQAQLDLDKVLLIPYPRPPHREFYEPGAHLRWCMCATLALRHPWLEASRVEIDRPGPSYSVDTLRELAASGEDELFLLLGGDQAAALPTWHLAPEVVELATIAFTSRAGWVSESAAAFPSLYSLPRVSARTFQMPACGVSSSLVRDRIAAGRPWRALVPSEIANFIEREGLYLP
jgi:nicotinate-nucleotide adenylyltransferase